MAAYSKVKKGPWELEPEVMYWHKRRHNFFMEVSDQDLDWIAEQLLSETRHWDRLCEESYIDDMQRLFGVVDSDNLYPYPGNAA